ncbi:hypothetical protein ACGFRG_07010 [Streptomyces sp. NPDC048696]|uniref:hypothetical protein n=1 Tax=Streptomyces sp. NPDC048696 TaxID=3365585 RepID=UPI00371C02BD
MVSSHWETPSEESQRPRRYYKLTGEGVQAARLELAQRSLDSATGCPGTGRPATGNAR